MKNAIITFVFILLSLMTYGQENIDTDNIIEEPQSFQVLERNGKTHYFGQVYKNQKKGIGTEFLEEGTLRTGYFENDLFLGDFIVAPPWHLLDVDYEFRDDMPFEKFSVDLTVKKDINDSAFFYIAPFCGEINGVGFYGGVQTMGGGYPSRYHNIDESTFSSLGRIGIFSRWGIRDPIAMKMAPNGSCESSGYEGDFVSVRNSINWSKGTYTLSIKNTHETVMIDSVLHSYLEMCIYSHQDKESVSLGKLAFPGKEMVLAKRNFGFIEHYSTYEKIENIPKGQITLSKIKINNRLQNIHNVWDVSEKNYPIWARSWTEGNTIQIQFGEPYTRKKYGESAKFYFNQIKE
ncbi:hypothetical protein OAH04_00210 [Crocinitomicaceae bacterium]|nr:hypothetical protein [Crocinitomicaceae bacterium]